MEVATFLIQITHLNHFQRIHILNLNHRVVRKGITTHLQRPQLGTILQTELTTWIIATVILLPREAVHSNLHTVEKTHPSQNQLIYSRETLISNLQLTKLLESRQNQFCQSTAIHAMVNDNISHIGIQICQVFSTLHICIWVVMLLRQMMMTRQRTDIYCSLTHKTNTRIGHFTTPFKCILRKTRLVEIGHA